MEDAAGGLLLQRSEGAEAVASGSGRIDCAADYGSTDPCCGNDDGTGTVAPQYVCPSDKPICVDYVYGYEYGKCTGSRIDCAADYGSTEPCCGNDGTGTVAPQYVCPSAKPFCVDYVYGSEWGKCTGCDACKDSSMCCNPHDKFFIYSCPGCGSF